MPLPSRRSPIFLLVGLGAVSAVPAACGARAELLGVTAGGEGGAPVITSSSSGVIASSSSGATASSSGVIASSSSGASTSSSSGAGGQGGGITCSPEICDGLDNDCNGLVDDGLGTLSCGVGACANTAPACVNGAPGTCVPLPPSPEKCDGIDNDCNGIVDDGCTPGCADGTREGFADVTMYPGIAACSGGWTVPGLTGALQPACNHNAGDDSANPNGAGCSAADLCAPGFHVCNSAAEVAARSPTGCEGAATAPNRFFATRQSSTGCGQCALGGSTDPMICNGCSCAPDCAQTALTANDVFGCGSLGDSAGDCGVLNRFSNDQCGALGPPWNCTGDGCSEAGNVTKPGSARGGVLCCLD